MVVLEACYDFGNIARNVTARAELIAENETAITIAPIFIGTGGHIARDIAEIVASFQNQHPNITFNLLPPLGTHPLVLSAMAKAALESV